MEGLKRILGLAPSEDPEGFRERLRGERRRIGEALAEFRQNSQPQGKKGRKLRKKKKDSFPPEVLEKAKALGWTMEELEKFFSGGTQ